MDLHLHSLAACFLLLSLSPSASAQVPGDEPGDTGSITFLYQGVPTTYALVRAADGNVWLQQNMGAAQVATTATDVSGYGGLYQWGRWTDGHQLRTSLTFDAGVLSPNNPAGLTGSDNLFYIGSDPNGWWPAGSDADSWTAASPSATNGIDPCAAIGENWQLPARTDWIEVMTAEDITGVPSAFASYLKLTAAGSRDGASGTIINAGTYGNYWAATPNTVYAKDVTIGADFVNADDDAYRGYGMCVRCLNKQLHTGVDELRNSDGLNVYPNPSNGTFTLDGPAVITSITLYTSDMRMVRSVPLNVMKGTVDLDDVPAGIYLLQAATAKGSSWRTISITR